MPNVRPIYRRDEIARELKTEFPERVAVDTLPWHSVVCSRLGKNLVAKRAAISVTRKFIEAASRRGERTLIVRDTASQPWSDRACELLGLPSLRIAAHAAAAAETQPPWMPLEIASWCRDELAIELADRIDATFVRSGGKIMRLLCDRLERDPALTVQVFVTSANDVAAKELIARGAIGYWLNFEHRAESLLDEKALKTTSSSSNEDCVAAINSLVEHPDQWLIHSTREQSGAWPGQSQQQFNDWLLLSEPSIDPSSPLETLRRIVHEKRLIGSHRTTSSSSVVCFSALPIMHWLARRKFRPHLSRWDAEPYGVALSRSAATRLGVQSVIYGDKQTLASLDAIDRWRFQSVGTTYDWKSEQEWRGAGVIDLAQFATDEVIVFVKDTTEPTAVGKSPWPIVSVASLQAASLR